MTQPRELLVLYAKAPQPGRVKTRLIPFLGERRATAVYQKLAQHTFWQAKELQNIRSILLRLDYEGDSPLAMASWAGPEFTLEPQASGDLTQRLQQSLQTALTQAPHVLIIGTDCPGITAELLSNAFDALQQVDLVLGPALDGGYYLIGLKAFHPALFEGIEWSTAKVLQQTLAQAHSLGLQSHQLPQLRDLDFAEDFQALLPEFPWLSL